MEAKNADLDVEATKDNGDARYTCPLTGAHFEFRDLCKRLQKVLRDQTQESTAHNSAVRSTPRTLASREVASARDLAVQVTQVRKSQNRN